MRAWPWYTGLHWGTIALWAYLWLISSTTSRPKKKNIERIYDRIYLYDTLVLSQSYIHKYIMLWSSPWVTCSPRLWPWEMCELCLDEMCGCDVGHHYGTFSHATEVKQKSFWKHVCIGHSPRTTNPHSTYKHSKTPSWSHPRKLCLLWALPQRQVLLSWNTSSLQTTHVVSSSGNFDFILSGSMCSSVFFFADLVSFVWYASCLCVHCQLTVERADVIIVDLKATCPIPWSSINVWIEWLRPTCLKWRTKICKKSQKTVMLLFHVLDTKWTQPRNTKILEIFAPSRRKGARMSWVIFFSLEGRFMPVHSCCVGASLMIVVCLQIMSSNWSKQTAAPGQIYSHEQHIGIAPGFERNAEYIGHSCHWHVPVHSSGVFRQRGLLWALAQVRWNKQSIHRVVHTAPWCSRGQRRHGFIIQSLSISNLHTFARMCHHTRQYCSIYWWITAERFHLGNMGVPGTRSSEHMRGYRAGCGRSSKDRRLNSSRRILYTSFPSAVFPLEEFSFQIPQKR